MSKTTAAQLRAVKKYQASPKGRESIWRMNRSEKSLQRKRNYNVTPKGRERTRRANKTPKGRTTKKRYQQSELGRNTDRVYRRMLSYDKALARYEAEPTDRNYRLLMQCRGA